MILSLNDCCWQKKATLRTLKKEESVRESVGETHRAGAVRQMKCLSAVDVGQFEIPRTSRYSVLRGKSVEAGSGYRRGGGHRWFEGRHARAPFIFVDDLEVFPPNPSEKQRILRSEEKSVVQKLVNIKAGEGS